MFAWPWRLEKRFDPGAADPRMLLAATARLREGQVVQFVNGDVVLDD